MRGSNENKGGVGLLQISQKERLFHVLYQPIGNLVMWSPFYTLPKKAFLCSSVWERKEYIWKLNWKESLLIYFENCKNAPCSHRQSRNMMMNTFIIVNITPICRQVRDSLEDKSMLLVHFKKVSLSLYLGTHLKVELTDYCFILKVTRVFRIPTQAK